MVNKAPGVRVTQNTTSPPAPSVNPPEGTAVFFGLAEKGPAWAPVKLSGDSLSKSFKSVFGEGLTNEVGLQTLESLEQNGTSEAYFVRMLAYDGTAVDAGTANMEVQSVGSASFAKLISATPVVFPIAVEANNSNIVFSIDESADTTTTISGTAATISGSGGTLPTTTLASTTFNYRTVVGGSYYHVDISSLSLADASAYALALNARMSGVSASVSGDQIVFTADAKGTSSFLQFASVSANAATALGISATSATGTGNVENRELLTFEEFKTRVESAESKLTVSQDSDNYLSFTSTFGVPGELSSITVVSGTAALLATLGISAGTTYGVEDDSTLAFTVRAGYLGEDSPGVFGNRVSVAVSSNPLYTSHGEGNDLSANIGAGDLSFTMPSGSGISKRSVIRVTDGVNTEYRTVTNTSNSVSSAGVNVTTITVDTAFENTYAYTGTTVESLEFDINVYVDDLLVESMSRLSANAEMPSYYADKVNETSKYIRVIPEEGTIPAVTVRTLLSGGSAGADLSIEDFVGDSNTKQGIYCLDNSDLPGMVISVPRGTSSDLPADYLLTNVLANYCKESGRYDAIAVAQTPSGLSTEQVLNYRNVTLGLESENAALYYPWVWIRNTKSASPTARVLIPPTGAVVAKLLNVTRVPVDQDGGIVSSPAGNSQFGLIKVMGVERQLSETDHAALNPVGVNAIMTGNSEGRPVFFIHGARTLSYVQKDILLGVMRLRKYIVKGIKTLFSTIVHRGNTPMNTIKDIGKLKSELFQKMYSSAQLNGATPEQAYYATSTTTNADVDALTQRIRCGYVPRMAKEFIEVEITQHLTGELTVSER